MGAPRRVPHWRIFFSQSAAWIRLLCAQLSIILFALRVKKRALLKIQIPSNAKSRLTVITRYVTASTKVNSSTLAIFCLPKHLNRFKFRRKLTSSILPANIWKLALTVISIVRQYGVLSEASSRAETFWLELCLTANNYLPTTVFRIKTGDSLKT